MANPTIPPNIFLNKLEGQTTYTLCAKFMDGLNISFTVLFFVKNDKLNIKIPYFENKVLSDVYSRIMAHLWDLGFAVCYFREEETSGGKKTVWVTPTPFVTKKLDLSPSIEHHKLGFITNLLTGGRVPALEQNNTVTLLGKGFPFALALLSAMFPSLQKQNLTMEYLKKKMTENKGNSVDVFPALSVVKSAPAPWIKTVVEPLVAKAEPVVAKAEPVDNDVENLMLFKTLQKELKVAEENRKKAEAIEKDLNDRVAALKLKLTSLLQ